MVGSLKKASVLLAILVAAQFSTSLIVSLAESNAYLQILSYTGFLTPYAGTQAYRVVGEVKNTGINAYTNVLLNITLYDSSNNTIASRNVQTELLVIGPNRKSPFSFMELNLTIALQVSRCEVAIASYSETQPKEGKLELYSFYDRYKIRGEISNKGTTATRFVVVFATFYDANERVVDVYSSQTIFQIESYNSEFFDIFFPSPDMFKRARWYSLTAESQNYTINEETGLMSFLPPPQPYAKFEVTPVNAQVGQVVTFNASGSYDLDGNITSYIWDFGDGNNITTSDPIITYSYTANGTYTITLVVIDNDGYNSTAVGQITVYPSISDNDGTYALFVFFGICIAFSAAVLFIAIGLAKWQHKPRRKHLKHVRITRTSYKIKSDLE